MIFPGKLFVIIRKIKKIVNTITKLIQAFKIKIIGKQIFGNLIFFSTFALSKNKVIDREKISANKPQHKIPTHR